MASEKTSKKGRGGAITLVITLVLIGLIGTLAFIAVDRAILNDRLDRSFVNPWIAQYKIVYQCVDEFSTQQLCLVNSDGSGARQLTFGGNGGVEYYQPQINAVGQIVARCVDHQSGTEHYCLLHTDRPNEIYRISETFGSDHPALINDLGEIVHHCGRRANDVWLICLSRANSDEESEIETFDIVTGGGTFAINNRHYLAHACGFSGSYEICLTSFATDDQIVITPNPSLQLTGIESLLLNDRNELVILCKIEAGVNQRQLGICLANEREKRIDLIPLTPQYSLFTLGSLTDDTIVLTCFRGKQILPKGHVCAMDFENYRLEELSGGEDGENDLGPSVNEAGLIVYECMESQICLIDRAAEQVKVLTGHDISRPATSPKIQ